MVELKKLFNGILNTRLIIKSILYRLLALFIIFTISFLFTKNALIASVISIIELVTKLILYYLYEILWKNTIEKIEAKNVIDSNS